MNDFPRLLLEAIDDLAVVGLDLDGRIAVWSGGAERLVGYAAPEIVGRPASVLYPAEEAAAGRPQDDLRRAAEGAGLERAGWCVRKDGSRFRARLAVRPLRASGGRPAGFAWIAGEGAARAGAAGPGEEDARLRALVEQAPFSIQVFGRDGRCLSVNAAWARLWESRPEEVRDYNILRDPQVAERGLLAAVERAFRGERCTLPPVLYDPSAIGKEGRPRWTEGHIYPLHDAAGRVREVVLVHEDVTGRRAVEQALADSREMLQVVLNNIPEFVFWKDRDLRYRGCNARFARANGLQAPEDVVGRTDYDFRVLEEEANFFRAVDRRVMDSGRAEHGILEPVHRQDGSLRWLETNKIPLRDGEGQVVGVLGTYQDVTERREAEESRRRLEAERTALLERLQMVLERMPIACMLNDAEFRFTYWNPAAERTFGWRFDEVAGGHPFETITPPASHPAVAEIFRRLAAGDMTAHAIGENRTRDGRTILCDWINTPLNDRQGAFAGILSMAQDVTERVRAEEEVRRLNASLEQRVRERTAELQAVNAELEAFAYSVSHDLRAPLRHIDGFIDLLRKRSAPALDDTGRRYLDVISGSARTMGLLIDQLLAFSRTGRAELSRERVDLGALAEDVVEQLKGETGSRPVSIRVGPLPAVEADPTLLRTVLVNLMGNALKFTRDRDPALVEVGSRPGEAEEVVVFVRDNGVGFDPRFADKLFGVFQRLHRAEEFEGTGIGLASVRRIVQRHGGRTWAEGAPGAGATFYFTLPGSPARPTS